MATPLIQRARQGRTSAATLRTRLSNLRSRAPDCTVLIFEGPTDVGPFETWIHRIDGGFRYEPLPGDGKDQVLALRQSLSSDKVGLKEGVFFFVDHDFDGLKGHPEGPDIYCTDSYSIENYLVSERVISSIVRDELRCAANKEDEVRAVTAFRGSLQQFTAAMASVNLRIYRARCLGIRIASIEDSLPKYVAISVAAVTVLHTPASLVALIPANREPASGECIDIDTQFGSLDPVLNHRGKFLLAFLMKWVELLAADRRSGTPTVFSAAAPISFSTSWLTLRSLSSRSELPAGLPAFISYLRAKRSKSWDSRLFTLAHECGHALTSKWHKARRWLLASIRRHGP